MNLTLMSYTLRQRLLQPARLVLLLAAFSFPLMFAMLARGMGLSMLAGGHAFALILGAGLLGSDISAGVLQLLFARPVTRTEYVMSRWLAVAAGAATLAVLQIAIGATLLAGAGATFTPAAVATQMLEQALDAFGMTSVLLLFSSMLPGIGDVVALVCTQIAGAIFGAIGGFMHSPVLARAGREIQTFVQPEFSWAAAFAASQPGWFHLASYLSTVTLGLAIAVLVTNRRELSYATS